MLVSNARLVQVSIRPIDDYDAPASDTAKWSGAVECYLEQKTTRVSSGGNSELIRVWKVYVDASLEVAWAEDDLLRIEYQPRGFGTTATYDVPVQAIEIRDQPDMPDEVCTVALTVEPA